MPRILGTKNKINYRVPPACELSTDDRLRLIANIIIDRIEAKLKSAAKAEGTKHE